MRVLILGGTGAMGSHLCRLLADRGHEVVCTTRSDRQSLHEGIDYAMGNAKDQRFLATMLEDHWDAVIDFMVWSTPEFESRCETLLASANQYVFTSSYRVYADSEVITEESPRLLDVSDDKEYLVTDEYALSKARCENLLFESEKRNWTIVRPAVTYDGGSRRLQLGVYEAADWLWRVVHGVSVPMPEEMLDKQATMSYGGDVAEMISRLVGNPDAAGEVFTVSGSDHMSWGDVADVYRFAMPLEVVPCSLESFERARGGIYQIRYDRMFNRVVDNSKVLSVTGLDPGSLTKMREGLGRAATCLLDSGWRPSSYPGFQARLDRLCGGAPSLTPILREGGAVAAAKYCVRRVVG